MSGRNHDDVGVLAMCVGNMPCFPLVLLHVKSVITPIISSELGLYETGNNAVLH